MTFTDSQREAIESAGRGDVCVVAGPGSGKTTVLVERLRRLVERDQVDADSIVAITFTRKAALGMKTRLVESTIAAPGAVRRRIERVQVSTIHSFCARLLRENAVAAEIDPDFQQIDEGEAAIRLRRAVEEALNQLWSEDPDGAALFLREFKETNTYTDESDGGSAIHKQLESLVESVRSRGEKLWCKKLDCKEQPAREWITAAGRRAIEVYQQGKLERALLDFTDLEQRTLDLLTTADSHVRFDFEHVLLDENQDTNPLQAKLVAKLTERARENRPTLFAVGDVNQSIYLFRHAEPQVFANYRDRVEEQGHVVELYDNFRSRPEILAAVRQLTRGVEGLEDRELIARRELPEKAEPSVEVMLCFGPASDKTGIKERREALWITKRIVELRGQLRIGKDGRPPDWRDFAVLVRKNHGLETFAEAFRSAGVPYQVNAGRGFFDSREVRDLLCFLRALDDPHDDVSLASAMRSPLGEISEETLLRLKAPQRPLYDGFRDGAALSDDEASRLRRFLRVFEELRGERERASADVLLSRLLAATGYEAWLRSHQGGRQRAANLEKLGRLAARASGGEASFRRTLERLEATAFAGGGEPEAAVPESSDGVQLLTVHTAKGLEFPVVFLPSLQSSGRSGSDSLLFDPENGLGARWKPINVGKSRPDDNPDEAYAAIHRRVKPRHAEEDNRVLYVGLTRAEEHLVVSAAYGTRLIASSWAKTLKNNLGIPWERKVAAPRVIEAEGFSYRFAAYDEDPTFGQDKRTAEQASAAESLSPLSLANQADSEAAVTSVGLFADCPRRYYLSRYLGLEPEQARTADSDDEAGPAPPPPDELEPSELGRVVHEVLGGIVSRENAPAEALELVDRFEQSDLGRRAAADPDAQRERSLLFPLDGRLLRGQVDLLLADADGRVLLDYKTDRVSGAQVEERSRHYALQLQLYALGLANAGERPDRAVLYFLGPDRAVDVDLSDEALAAARRAVADLFAAQESGEFPVQPAERCRRCPHFEGLCPVKIPSAGPKAGTKGQMSLFL